MQKLHLVGLTTDKEGVILSARRGTRSGGFLLTIDEALEAAVDDLRARRADEHADHAEADAVAQPSRVESTLPVREIQARLRQGRSIAEVAKAAGVDPEWVDRFAPPILAERAQVIARVRAVPLRRPRLGPSAQPIGNAVRHHLADRGVALTPDEFADAWTARQVAEGRWAVRFGFHYRGRSHVLQFDLDDSSGEVIAADRASGQLGYVAPPSTSTSSDASRRKPKPPPRARPTVKRAVVSTGFRPDGSTAKAVSRPAKERQRAAEAMRKGAAQRAVQVERAAARRVRERTAEVARMARENKAAVAREAREQRQRERAAADKATVAAAKARKAAATKAAADKAKVAAAKARKAAATKKVAAKTKATATKKAAATKKATVTKKAATGNLVVASKASARRTPPARPSAARPPATNEVAAKGRLAEPRVQRTTAAATRPIRTPPLPTAGTGVVSASPIAPRQAIPSRALPDRPARPGVTTFDPMAVTRSVGADESVLVAPPPDLGATPPVVRRPMFRQEFVEQAIEERRVTARVAGERTIEGAAESSPNGLDAEGEPMRPDRPRRTRPLRAT